MNCGVIQGGAGLFAAVAIAARNRDGIASSPGGDEISVVYSTAPKLLYAEWVGDWTFIAPGVFSLNCGVIQGGAGLFAAVAIAARNRDGIASSPGGDEIRWCGAFCGGGYRGQKSRWNRILAGSGWNKVKEKAERISSCFWQKTIKSDVRVTRKSPKLLYAEWVGDWTFIAPGVFSLNCGVIQGGAGLFAAVAIAARNRDGIASSPGGDEISVVYSTAPKLLYAEWVGDWTFIAPGVFSLNCGVIQGGAGLFAAVAIAARNRDGIASSPGGDEISVVYSTAPKLLYAEWVGDWTCGAGLFAAVAIAARNRDGIASSPGGDGISVVYSTAPKLLYAEWVGDWTFIAPGVFSLNCGVIQGGAGLFAAVAIAARNRDGIASSPGGDEISVVYSTAPKLLYAEWVGDWTFIAPGVFSLNCGVIQGGAGLFAAVAIAARNRDGIASSPGGDEISVVYSTAPKLLYAEWVGDWTFIAPGVFSLNCGVIQGGAGLFAAVAIAARNRDGIASSPGGDEISVVYSTAPKLLYAEWVGDWTFIAPGVFSLNCGVIQGGAGLFAAVAIAARNRDGIASSPGGDEISVVYSTAPKLLYAEWVGDWTFIAPGVFSLNCGVIQGGAGLFAAVAIAARNRDGIASSPGGDEISVVYSTAPKLLYAEWVGDWTFIAPGVFSLNCGVIQGGAGLFAAVAIAARNRDGIASSPGGDEISVVYSTAPKLLYAEWVGDWTFIAPGVFSLNCGVIQGGAGLFAAVAIAAINRDGIASSPGGDEISVVYSTAPKLLYAEWVGDWTFIAPGVFSLNCGVIQGGAGLFAAVAIAARNRDGIASSPGGDEIRAFCGGGYRGQKSRWNRILAGRGWNKVKEKAERISSCFWPKTIKSDVGVTRKSLME
ncbi:hypothetical protein KIW84_055089 [Lathyrus oleraceus]|uniref:Uncharacterized protein n=1 Tax=Pisum sativum TaxID=3888 RepID=A0A9D5AI81_PEA|nr:hypothetical protein KIW84_055089 [Pisum sativum]